MLYKSQDYRFPRLDRSLTPSRVLFLLRKHSGVLRDDVLYLARFKRHIPLPAPEASGPVDRFDPFVQCVAFGLVLRAVGPFDLEGQKLATRQTNEEVRDVSPPRVGASAALIGVLAGSSTRSGTLLQATVNCGFTTVSTRNTFGHLI